MHGVSGLLSCTYGRHILIPPHASPHSSVCFGFVRFLPHPLIPVSAPLCPLLTTFLYFPPLAWSMRREQANPPHGPDPGPTHRAVRGLRRAPLCGRRALPSGLHATPRAPAPQPIHTLPCPREEGHRTLMTAPREKRRGGLWEENPLGGYSPGQLFVFRWSQGVSDIVPGGGVALSGSILELLRPPSPPTSCPTPAKGGTTNVRRGIRFSKQVP